MNSMTIFALVPTLLALLQWYPSQSIPGANHSHAGAANGFLAPQRPEDSKREFVVFDATLFKQKPDLTRYGLRPISMIFKETLWPAGRDGVRARVRR